MIVRLHSSLFLLALSACSDVEKDGSGGHEHELITTVVLTFTSDTAEAGQYRWTEGDDRGENILLQNGADYTLSVEFLNEEETEVEDVTPEIADEADEHQLFFTGDAVDGPATNSNPEAIIEHSYADQDAGELPIGLENTISTLGVGATDGDWDRKNGLVVSLRHMPKQNDKKTKVSGLAGQLASEGFASLPGANDVIVIFPVEVE